MKYISSYNAEQIVKRLKVLAYKMDYDRQAHLTHTQRNMNDDWNKAYLEDITRSLNDLIPQDDIANVRADEIPF